MRASTCHPHPRCAPSLAQVGPTEFWPGSHIAHNVGRIEEMASYELEADAGPSTWHIHRHTCACAHNGFTRVDAHGAALPRGAGDAIIFDYRTFHRGMPNHSGARRPLLYQTYSRPWFRDEHNFPPDASLKTDVVAPPGGAARSEGEGGAGGGAADGDRRADQRTGFGRNNH